MPRISNLTNFDGEIIATQPWVLSKIKDIQGGGGTNSVFIKDTCETSELASYMNGLGASTGDMVVIQAGSAKGNYIFTSSTSYVKLIDETSTDGDISEITSRVTNVETDISNIVNKINNDGETVYKIKTSVLPDIAITRVYTINASSEVNAGKTVNALIASALGENTAQTGDMIVITAEDQTRAEEVAGNYIITNDVEQPGNITSDNYVKMYAGTGSVVSVNGVAPVAGNVQLSIENLDDITITYSEIEGVKTVNTISIKNTEIVKKTDLTPITDRITQVEKDVSELASVDEDLANINKDITLIKSQQTNNISAIERAVQLYETEIPLVNGENGVTIDIAYQEDGITFASKTITVLTSGRILQVWDSSGKMIVPDITYSGSVTMLTAKYGKNTPDSKWTLLRSVPITVDIATPTEEETGN